MIEVANMSTTMGEVRSIPLDLGPVRLRRLSRQ